MNTAPMACLMLIAIGASTGASAHFEGGGFPGGSGGRGPRPGHGEFPGEGRPGMGRHRRIPPGARGRPIRVRPPRSSQPDEVMAARLVAEVSQGMSCERAGEVLRRLSNRLLASAEDVYRPERPGRPVIAPGEKERWRGHIRSPQFWKEVWDRLAEVYQSCDSDCFDDGVAVGIMSSVGYCSASIELGGLNAPGLITQGRLPLCENSIFVGCQQGYSQGVQMTEGCSLYTQGVYQKVYLESQSQDCHIDEAPGV